jgi:hypothetical protein
MGIEMEAGRPGWYDALNGLPGLFGSSMPETYELLRLVNFLLEKPGRIPARNRTAARSGQTSARCHPRPLKHATRSQPGTRSQMRAKPIAPRPASASMAKPSAWTRPL